MITIPQKDGAIHLAESILMDGNLSTSFAGWGSQRIVAMSVTPSKDISIIADTSSTTSSFEVKQCPRDHLHKSHGLPLFNSVSIAGCDLLSSCLYTAGVCTAISGKVSSSFLAR
jgi:hypothetical protein